MYQILSFWTPVKDTEYYVYAVVFQAKLTESTMLLHFLTLKMLIYEYLEYFEGKQVKTQRECEIESKVRDWKMFWVSLAQHLKNKMKTKASSLTRIKINPTTILLLIFFIHFSVRIIQTVCWFWIWSASLPPFLPLSPPSTDHVRESPLSSLSSLSLDLSWTDGTSFTKASSSVLSLLDSCSMSLWSDESSAKSLLCCETFTSCRHTWNHLRQLGQQGWLFVPIQPMKTLLTCV